MASPINKDYGKVFMIHSKDKDGKLCYLSQNENGEVYFSNSFLSKDNIFFDSYESAEKRMDELKSFISDATTESVVISKLTLAPQALFGADYLDN